MKIQKVWAVWFSATGTTEKVVNSVAKDIAEKLNVPFESRSFNTPAARKEEMTFAKKDVALVRLRVEF